MLKIEDYRPGMIVYGKVTGIQGYGAFVTFEGDVSGLIHISEISDKFVRDVSNFVNIGDYVFVKVIDVDRAHRQLRLSLKAINQNARKARKKAKFSGLPKNIIGFGSLDKKLAQWIKEGENI